VESAEAMTVAQLLAGVLRLTAIVLPVAFTSRRLQRAYVPASGALAALAGCVLALSLLLVGAELLGVASLLRSGPIIGLFVLIAIGARAVIAVGETQRADAAPAHSHRPAARLLDVRSAAAVLGLCVVVAQWCVQSANALGAGMLNFDTLWYHMPFAARFAQTGSVAAIQFTQADPITAYYPANSELVHAIGIVALHSDLLSPLLNLLWLAVAMLACWCFGRPWRLERETLTAGCLALSLPVLAATQPGQAFNDIPGLAMLLAAAALVVHVERKPSLLVLAGLALGFAAGVKATFLVPALAMVATVPLLFARGRRVRALLALAPPVALTAGWWYLRNLVDTGNPLGLRLHLGPLLLPGPRSPIANALQQTVFSELEHVSLWQSRFAPGLSHALGPLWPAVLALCLGAVVTGVGIVRDSRVRVLALAAGAAGITYLFLPTGATAIGQGTSLFEVNLRYATPALAIGLVLAPIVLSRAPGRRTLRAPGRVGLIAPGLLALLLITQFEHALWPTQTGRHAAAIAIVACAVAGLALARRVRERVSIRTWTIALLSMVVLGAGGAAYAVQRHYFDRRYHGPYTRDPALGAIFRWAQHVARARIALYGAVTQYPLYGARDSNRVDYLGEHTGEGGVRPISSCSAWRRALTRGRYDYLVLTPAPTGSIPAAWTQSDAAATLALHPAPDEFVFQVHGPMHPEGCGR
jgi:hypothetical protein